MPTPSRKLRRRGSANRPRAQAANEERAARAADARFLQAERCSVCGTRLESFEQNLRNGFPVCDYHDHLWAKD
jgi:hypothetical protein